MYCWGLSLILLVKYYRFKSPKTSTFAFIVLFFNGKYFHWKYAVFSSFLHMSIFSSPLFFNLFIYFTPFVSLQRAPVWSLASAVSSCPLATANQPWLLCSACSGESASLPGTPWMCWPLSSTPLTKGRQFRHAVTSPRHCEGTVSGAEWRVEWCHICCPTMTYRDGWHWGVKSLAVHVM